MTTAERWEMLLTVLNAPLFYIEHKSSDCQQTDFFYSSFVCQKPFHHDLASQQYQMVSIVRNQSSHCIVFYFIASNTITTTRTQTHTPELLYQPLFVLWNWSFQNHRKIMFWQSRLADGTPRTHAISSLVTILLVHELWHQRGKNKNLCFGVYTVIVINIVIKTYIVLRPYHPPLLATTHNSLTTLGANFHMVKLNTSLLFLQNNQ